MSKKTVFSNPSADESHSRNAFDRSFIKNINFSGGQLLPTFCQFVFGHSHVRINQRSTLRTALVLRPAFQSMPFYTDYFFVPMHQLMSMWNDFRSRVNDRHSSLLGVPTRLPSFTDSVLRDMLDDQSSGLSPYLDAAGFPLYQGVIRLLDLLNYGNNLSSVSVVSGSISSNAVGSCTPLKLCAYQKIYYDHYRNTAYEPNDPSRYNLDQFYSPANISNGSVAPTAVSKVDLGLMTELHYVNYRRDMFNTVYPSLNFVATQLQNLQSLNTLPSSIANGFLRGSAAPYSVNTEGVAPYNGSFVNVNQVKGYSSNNYIGSGFSTQMLRSAFALEKLLRVSAFTPQHVRDQFKARFGYVPKSSNLHESVRLGSFKNDVVLGEVTSMADTGLASLGEVSGKGFGFSDYSKPISYDVPEDGFIMGISYVLPQQVYDSNFVDCINQQFLPEDWSLPEYENLGLQPLYNKNVAIARNGSSDTDNAQLARGNQIIGYQPRDMQYKASVSQNHGEFITGYQLSPFALHGKRDILHTIATLGTTGVSSEYFKCTPQDFDDIFAQSADGSQPKDHFYGNIVTQFACIQDKPILGIPKL